jgi:hypothetical protein
MADLFKTRDQLIQRALKELGALLPGEAAAPEDYATVDDMIDPLVAQLNSDTVYYVQDPDQIELDAFMPLARLLANVCGPEFGAPINDDAKTRDEAILKRIGSTRPTFEAQRVDYF